MTSFDETERKVCLDAIRTILIHICDELYTLNAFTQGKSRWDYSPGTIEPWPEPEWLTRTCNECDYWYCGGQKTACVKSGLFIWEINHLACPDGSFVRIKMKESKTTKEE